MVPVVVVADLFKAGGLEPVGLVDRLLSQVQRIQRINHLDTITPRGREAAREALLIGR